jgi:hypothetical protein
MPSFRLLVYAGLLGCARMSMAFSRWIRSVVSNPAPPSAAPSFPHAELCARVHGFPNLTAPNKRLPHFHPLPVPSAHSRWCRLPAVAWGELLHTPSFAKRCRRSCSGSSTRRRGACCCYCCCSALPLLPAAPPQPRAALSPPCLNASDLACRPQVLHLALSTSCAAEQCSAPPARRPPPAPPPPPQAAGPSSALRKRSKRKKTHDTFSFVSGWRW